MSNSQGSLRESTLLAWRKVIDSLIELSFDGGISVQDVAELLRQRSVRAAAERINRNGGHASNARIAIITGLPRSEVARALKTPELPAPRIKKPPAGGVLEAWHSNPAFTTRAGKPAVLPIFGKDRTFEQLVQANGRGTPVRAMLDQLLEVKAITVLRNRYVKVSTPRPKAASESKVGIADLGERTADFIETLKGNLKKSSNPLFERTKSEWIDAEEMPQVRMQVEEQGIKFIKSISLTSNRSQPKISRHSSQGTDQRKVGITVFYFEKLSPHDSNRQNTIIRRRNFKRTAKAP